MQISIRKVSEPQLLHLISSSSFNVYGMVCMFINFCFKITSSKTKYYQMITGQDAAAGNKYLICFSCLLMKNYKKIKKNIKIKICVYWRGDDVKIYFLSSFKLFFLKGRKSNEIVEKVKCIIWWFFLFNEKINYFRIEPLL